MNGANMKFSWTGRSIAFLMGVLPFANASRAADTNLQVAGIEGHLGAQWRAEMESNDHGLMKDDNNSPLRTQTMALKTFKLRLLGKFSPTVDYKFRYNFVNSGIEHAKMSYSPSSYITIGIGNDQVKQGGFEMKAAGYETFMYSPYHDTWKPFKEYATVLDVTLNLAGKVTFELTEDVATNDYPASFDGKTNTGAVTTTKTQPGMALEWVGDFGPIKPLLQFGSYDTNASRYIVAGVKGKVEGFEASFDYTLDRRARRYANNKYYDQLTNITVMASYDIPEVAKPFLTFAGYKNKTASDDDVGLKEATSNGKAKSATAASPFDDNLGAKNFEQNGVAWSVGTFFMQHEKNFRPYVALTNRGGKFAVADTGDPSREDTRTEMSIRLGACGEF